MIHVKLQAVLMDLGETLVHFAKPWEEVSYAQIREVYAYLNYSGLETDFQSFGRMFVRVYNGAAARADTLKIEIPLEEIISKTLSKFNVKNLSTEFLHKAAKFYFMPEIDAWQPYTDAVDTLSRLTENKFKLGIVSNAKSEWVVHEILSKYDLQKYFGTVVTSAAMRVRKPRSDIFSKALKDLEVEAKDAVFIGDSLEADIGGAKKVGMHSIYVSRKPQENPGMSFPEATVFSLTEAVDTIMLWNTRSSQVQNQHERGAYSSIAHKVLN